MWKLPTKNDGTIGININIKKGLILWLRTFVGFVKAI